MLYYLSWYWLPSSERQKLGSIFFSFFAAFFFHILVLGSQEQRVFPPSSIGHVYCNSVRFDKKKDAWVLEGAVEVYRKRDSLRADRLLYIPSKDLCIAEKNVVYKTQSGELLASDKVILHKSFSKIIAAKISFFIEQGGIIAAESFDWERGQFRAKKIAFTSCHFCRKKGKKPMWEIRAKSVTRDSSGNKLSFQEPSLEFWGQPVLGLHSLQLPLKRQTGFLKPFVGQSSMRGFFAGAPFFIALKQSNLTITPVINTKGTFLSLCNFDWQRQNFNLASNCSLQYEPKRKDMAQPVETEFRGHAFWDASWFFTDHWRFLFSGKLVTDQTYMRYLEGIISDKELTVLPYFASNVGLEYFDERAYGEIGFKRYQSFFQKNHPFLDVPGLSFRWISPSWHNCYATFWSAADHLNASSVVQAGGHGPSHKNYGRLSTYISFNWRAATILGQVLHLYGDFRADLYHLSRFLGSPYSQSDYLIRCLPGLGGRLSWPFYYSRPQLIVDPFVSVRLSPTIDQSSFPNGDVAGFEYHEGSLWGRTRLPGRDQLDSGIYSAYGFQLTWYSSFLGETHFLFGQLFSVTDPHPILKSGGVKKGFSDWVGALSMAPASFFAIDYRFRLDQNNNGVVFGEGTCFVGPPDTRIGVSYSKWSDIKTVPVARKQHESFGFSLNLGPFAGWSFQGNQKYDLRLRRWTTLEIGLAYVNECFQASCKFSRTYYHDKGLSSNNTFVLSVGLKGLGYGSLRPERPI